MAAAVRRIDDPDALRSLQELHHDLRQPLAAINGLASAALAQPGVPDTAAACLSEIGEQATLLLSMCRVVLEQPPIQAPVPMHVVVYEAATGFRWSHDVSVRVDAEPVLALADPVELRRALVNLVENAVRVSGDDGTVSVVVRADETTVWVEVADSGPGFASGESGTASLGLAIVERFARRHGGSLDIVRSPSGGTAVRFSLPRAGGEPRRQGRTDGNRVAG